MTTATQDEDTEYQNKIEAILKENTGRHMLDSGGAYGRHWEENQGRDFENEDPFEIEVWDDGVNVFANIYHFLDAFLEFTDDAQEKTEEFYQFANQDEYEREPWLDIIQELYGGRMTNTYNFENVLSQVIQYSFLTEDPDTGELYASDDPWHVDYVVLQVHNGCDVRGGYTKPVVFEFIGDPDYWRTKMVDLFANCDHEMYHSDDSGYNWYAEGIDSEVNWSFDRDNNKVYCKTCLENALEEREDELVGKKRELLDEAEDGNKSMAEVHEELIELEDADLPELEDFEVTIYWTPDY